jgi:hypothetical protein
VNVELALLVLMLPGVLKTVLRPIVQFAGLHTQGLPQCADQIADKSETTEGEEK